MNMPSAGPSIENVVEDVVGVDAETLYYDWLGHH